jgi:hypothetical protein
MKVRFDILFTIRVSFTRNAYSPYHFTLQKNNTENSKQIFPEKELPGHSPNFHIHVSVSDLYIGLPILLQENMWTDPRLYKALTDT